MKRAPLPHLMTGAEVAEALGIKPQTLRNYRSMGRWDDFPEPVVFGPSFARWLAADIAAFIERHRRRSAG